MTISPQGITQVIPREGSISDIGFLISDYESPDELQIFASQKGSSVRRGGLDFELRQIFGT
jgi:hypothetical protein